VHFNINFSIIKLSVHNFRSFTLYNLVPTYVTLTKLFGNHDAKKRVQEEATKVKGIVLIARKWTQYALSQY